MRDSPSDEELPDGLELLRGKPLGEDVRLLLGGPNILSHDALAFADVGAKEVVLEGQVFVACGHLGDVDKCQTSLVVLKDSGADQALGDELHVEPGSNLLEKGTHGEKLPHGHAKCDVLRSSGAESDLRLKLACPNDGAAKECERVAGPRLD